MPLPTPNGTCSEIVGIRQRRDIDVYQVVFHAGYNIRRIHSAQQKSETGDHWKKHMNSNRKNLPQSRSSECKGPTISVSFAVLWNHSRLLVEIARRIFTLAAVTHARRSVHLPSQTRSRSNPSTAVALVACLLSAPPQSQAAEPALDMKQTNSTVEQFKSFISSPPIIEELVWDLKVVPPGMKYNPEEGLGAFTNFQRLVARWQPNARSVYQIFPDYVSTNTVMNWFSISVYDKKHWQLTPSGFLIVWHDDGALPGPKAQLNLVKSGVDYLTYRLGEVLNMGVFNLGIGSIRWQGDIFSATNSNIGLRFHGALQLSPEGVPSHLNFRSEIATNNRALTVRYSFEHSTGVSFLPDQIRVTEDSNGRELERAMIRIRSIKLASQPASEEAFLPSTNLLSVPAQLRFYTNGAHYALNSNGRLVPSPLGARPPDVRDQRRIYLAVCAAVSLAIFALMVRAKLEKNKNETLRAELTKELT